MKRAPWRATALLVTGGIVARAGDTVLSWILDLPWPAFLAVIATLIIGAVWWALPTLTKEP